jgi:putative membrane protein
MDYLYAKSLHIIFIITWFAGLFYTVRLFIYHTEANAKASPEKQILQNQYKIMTKRLWYMITWPSAILASLFAYWMLYINPELLKMPWMHVKLCFVVLLYIYHLVCHYMFKQLQNDIVKYTSTKLRLWNEIPTLILFSVVFIVVLKNAVNWIYGLIGIVTFGILLMIAIRIYKSIRTKS